MDANDAVANLHGLNQGSQVSLAERDFTLGDVRAHESAETDDSVRIKPAGRTSALDALQGGGSFVALGLELGDALLQYVVDLGDAVLHKLVEPRSLSSAAPACWRNASTRA